MFESYLWLWRERTGLHGARFTRALAVAGWYMPCGRGVWISSSRHHRLVKIKWNWRTRSSDYLKDLEYISNNPMRMRWTKQSRLLGQRVSTLTSRWRKLGFRLRWFPRTWELSSSSCLAVVSYSDVWSSHRFDSSWPESSRPDSITRTGLSENLSFVMSPTRSAIKIRVIRDIPWDWQEDMVRSMVAITPRFLTNWSLETSILALVS